MNKPLNVGDAVAAKNQLEQKILSLIGDFCENTGLEINDLSYTVSVARYGTGEKLTNRELNLVVTLP